MIPEYDTDIRIDRLANDLKTGIKMKVKNSNTHWTQGTVISGRREAQIGKLYNQFAFFLWAGVESWHKEVGYKQKVVFFTRLWKQRLEFEDAERVGT